ncbi:hypothetical protein HOI18_05455 [Candidatus Uhrbacteria bacterium]|nr:hypothetical protein [Candidatus Uhrbacteria bacterium]
MSQMRKGRAAEVYDKQIGKLPHWYKPWLHGAVTPCIAIICIAIALIYVDWPIGERLAFWVCSFVFLNLVEYCFHKFVMHRPPGAGALSGLHRRIYNRHRKMHHVVFTNVYIVDDPREASLILLPGLLAPVVIVGLILFSGLIWLIGDMSASLLMISSTTSYFAFYEMCHLVYHLSPTNGVASYWPINKLALFHRSHHVPRWMEKHNFNITVPLWDLILGTLKRPSKDDLT